MNSSCEKEKKLTAEVPLTLIRQNQQWEDRQTYNIQILSENDEGSGQRHDNYVWRRNIHSVGKTTTNATSEKKTSVVRP